MKTFLASGYWLYPLGTPTEQVAKIVSDTRYSPSGKLKKEVESNQAVLVEKPHYKWQDYMNWWVVRFLRVQGRVQWFTLRGCGRGRGLFTSQQKSIQLLLSVTFLVENG